MGSLWTVFGLTLDRKSKQLFLLFFCLFASSRLGGNREAKSIPPRPLDSRCVDAPTKQQTLKTSKTSYHPPTRMRIHLRFAFGSGGPVPPVRTMSEPNRGNRTENGNRTVGTEPSEPVRISKPNRTVAFMLSSSLYSVWLRSLDFASN